MTFFIALKDGCNVLLHWEVYLLTVVYALITSLPVYLNDDSNAKQSVLSSLTSIAADFIATTSLILILSPIILGISGSASWHYPIELITNNPYLIIIAFGIYVFLKILSSLIPYIGGYKTIQNLFFGGITVVYVLLDQEDKGVVKFDGSTIIVPTNYDLLGFVVLSVVCLWVGVILSGVLISIFYRKGTLWHCLSWSIASIFLFFPLFVYGAWLNNKF